MVCGLWNLIYMINRWNESFYYIIKSYFYWRISIVCREFINIFICDVLREINFVVIVNESDRGM